MTLHSSSSQVICPFSNNGTFPLRSGESIIREVNLHKEGTEVLSEGCLHTQVSVVLCFYLLLVSHILSPQRFFMKVLLGW